MVFNAAQTLPPPPPSPTPPHPLPATHLVGSLKKNTTLEYSTRVVQEGDLRCEKSTLNDLAYLTPLRIPLMNPVTVWGIKSTLALCWGRGWHRVPTVNALESTLEWTILLGEVIVSQLQHRVPYTMFFFGFGFCTLTLGRGEGWGRWTREKVRGAIVYKAGSKILT